jgi:hypothetical protein
MHLPNSFDHTAESADVHFQPAAIPRLERYLLISLAVFAAAIAACVMINPEGALDNNGISYYDHVGFSLAPYVIGVLSIATMAMLAARGLPENGRPWSLLRPSLDTIAVLLVLVLLTPDYVNQAFNVAHIAVSVALFGGQFALAAWLTLSVWRDGLNVGLFVVLTAVGLLAGASEIGWASFLFAGQIGFQIIFVAVMARVIARLDLSRPGDAVSASRTGLDTATSGSRSGS